MVYASRFTVFAQIIDQNVVVIRAMDAAAFTVCFNWVLSDGAKVYTVNPLVVPETSSQSRHTERIARFTCSPKIPYKPVAPCTKVSVVDVHLKLNPLFNEI